MLRNLYSYFESNRTVKFKKGETIFLQYGVPKYIYIIKSGIVEESVISHNGTRQSISYELIGDIIPKCWAFSRSDKTLFDYFALTNCELFVIEKDTFIQRLSKDVKFANEMLNQSVRSLVSTSMHVDILEKPNAKEKLLYTFRLFSLLYGINPKVNSVRIKVPFTQQDIAEFTGLTRETTSVELGKLKKLGVITVFHKCYSVDTAKLNEMIDDYYDPMIA